MRFFFYSGAILQKHILYDKVKILSTTSVMLLAWKLWWKTYEFIHFGTGKRYLKFLSEKILFRLLFYVSLLGRYLQKLTKKLTNYCQVGSCITKTLILSICASAVYDIMSTLTIKHYRYTESVLQSISKAPTEYTLIYIETFHMTIVR